MQHFILGATVILSGLIYALYKHKLTTAGALTGAAIAILLLYSLGYAAMLLMTAFFILGTLATSWMISSKRKLGLAEHNKGRRTAGQVLANAGVPACLAILAILDVSRQQLYMVMVASAFSSATADTLSSELGNVYGKRFYNIISFKKDAKGLDGVVSLEGSFAGLLGSVIIAILYAGFEPVASHVFIIILAGTVGNLFDSILGATVERKGIIQNDVVNFLNTIVGALVALLFVVFGS